MDDDFDDSYEGLLALGQIVGPVKRGCSEDTLGGLPHGTYAEFSATGPENNNENKVLGDSGNCAICLEDYVATDMCTKLPRCLHFYHKDCVKVSLVYVCSSSATDLVSRSGSRLQKPAPSAARMLKGHQELKAILDQPASGLFQSRNKEMARTLNCNIFEIRVVHQALAQRLLLLRVLLAVVRLLQVIQRLSLHTYLTRTARLLRTRRLDVCDGCACLRG